MGQALKRGQTVVTKELADAILDGNDGYGNYIAFQYYINLIEATDYQSPVAYKICQVLEDNIGPFNDFVIEGDASSKFPTKKPKGKDKVAYPEDSNPGRNRVLKEDWDHIKKFFAWRLASFETPIEKTTVFKNIDMLAGALYLDDTEREILTFLHIAQNDSFIEDMSLAIVDKDPGRVVPLISRFLDKSFNVEDISVAMSLKAALVSNGLIGLGEDDDLMAKIKGENGAPFPKISVSIQEMLPLVNLDTDSITETMLGKPAKATLSTSDFMDLEKEIATAKTIIRNAVERGETGINILFYGPPGSGKTELAKAIASELGLDLFAIGEGDEDDDLESKPDSSYQERVGELLQAHSFLKNKKGVMLFFDELEDLLTKGTDSDKNADPPSKITINRLLENNPIVTIWAGNNPEKFHTSLRQRFSYSFYVDYPPVLKRLEIWKKQAELHKVELPEKDFLSLARRYHAPARMIANAIRMASLSEVSLENIESFLHESSRITYGHVETIESNGGLGDNVRRSLFNYDKAKHNYVAEIIGSGAKPRPYSIFTRGIPGTGLRSFGRLLAERGSMNPHEADMRQLTAPSPLSSPETNIRNAFIEASDNRNLLVISHLDALRIDTERPNSEWQRDLSCIFSECISRHKLPVVVSSYLPDLEIPDYMQDIFSLDLKMHPLDEELCKVAYEKYFGKISEDESLAFPKGLVPGDFARASHILKKDLNGGAMPYKIIGLLTKQVASRTSQGHRPGF